MNYLETHILEHLELGFPTASGELYATTNDLNTLSGYLNSQIESSIGDWHYIGAIGEPTFENNWSNNSIEDTPASFRKDSNGLVYFIGVIKGGLAAEICTLPIGYRPIYFTKFTAGSLSEEVYSATQLNITTSGVVRTTNYSVDEIWFNVSFFTD